MSPSRWAPLACTFSTYVMGNWKGGQAVADVKPSSLKLQFTSIDHQEATAEMSGTFGPSHIIARLSEYDQLHFSPQPTWQPDCLIQ